MEKRADFRQSRRSKPKTLPDDLDEAFSESRAGEACHQGYFDELALGVAAGLGIWCFLHWVLDAVDHDETYENGLGDAE